MALGFKAQVVPNIPLEQGVNQGRLALPKASFDAERCDPGLEALAAYRWDFNERVGGFKSTPVHDWASHAADAWRYLALALKQGDARPKPLKYDLRGYI